MTGRCRSAPRPRARSPASMYAVPMRAADVPKHACPCVMFTARNLVPSPRRCTSSVWFPALTLKPTPKVRHAHDGMWGRRQALMLPSSTRMNIKSLWFEGATTSKPNFTVVDSLVVNAKSTCPSPSSSPSPWSGTQTKSPAFTIGALTRVARAADRARLHSAAARHKSDRAAQEQIHPQVGRSAIDIAIQVAEAVVESRQGRCRSAKVNWLAGAGEGTASKCTARTDAVGAVRLEARLAAAACGGAGGAVPLVRLGARLLGGGVTDGICHAAQRQGR